MTPASKILPGLQQASAWTEATRGGRELPSEADQGFLSLLDLSEPYAILGEHPAGTFQRCERLGWATMTHSAMWRLLPAGRIVLETRVHTPGHPALPQQGE